MFEKTNITPLGYRLLALMSRSSGEEFYLRELARRTKSSVAGCHSAARPLSAGGLVVPRRSGRNLYYRVDGTNPAMTYIKVFVNALEVGPVVEHLKPVASSVTLYGSCSTGRDTEKSDIDLLVLSLDKGAASEAIGTRTVGGRVLNALILSPHELAELRSRDRAFYDEVQKGLVLWRTEDG